MKVFLYDYSLIHKQYHSVPLRTLIANQMVTNGTSDSDFFDYHIMIETAVCPNVLYGNGGDQELLDFESFTAKLDYIYIKTTLLSNGRSRFSLADSSLAMAMTCHSRTHLDGQGENVG